MLEALKEVETALVIDPTSAAASLNRCILLTSLGKPAEAEACYDGPPSASRRVCPTVYRSRTRFRLAHGGLAGAEHDLRTAVGLSPAGSPGRAALERAELAKVARSRRSRNRSGPF